MCVSRWNLIIIVLVCDLFVAGMFSSSTKTRVVPAPLREKDSDLLVGGSERRLR